MQKSYRVDSENNVASGEHQFVVVNEYFDNESAIYFGIIKYRWLNHLDPNLNKSVWTDAEDKIIFEVQCFSKYNDVLLVENSHSFFSNEIFIIKNGAKLQDCCLVEAIILSKIDGILLVSVI